jgi:hypothetical protein
MNNTPEDTEILKAIKKCFTDNDMTEDGYTDYEDIELFDTDKVISDLMNFITLHTKEAYKKGYIEGGIAQLTNPTERKA